MQMTYVFGDHELDPARFQLRHCDLPVPVQPKVLRLLLYLVLHRERAVPKQELLTALWPAETVCRESIKRAVAAARRALGERGGQESSIRTARGHGYQFVQLVEVVRVASLDASARYPQSSSVSTSTPVSVT
jgi:DNA-binding winged helix-turn-helix (wHTH) protein